MANRSIFEDLSVAEIDLALEKHLKDKVFIEGAFDKKFAVPVWFRNTEANMRADSTSAGGDIYINWISSELADGLYRVQEPICEVIETDKNGAPVKYRIKPPPTPIWNHYTITARSDDLNCIRKIHNKLEKLFPADHTTLNVKGFKTPMRRENFLSSDLPDLGIFVRDMNIKILGYVYEDSCKSEICPAVGEFKLEIGKTLDPEDDDAFYEIDIC
ncbi:MAG: hypothetical protein R3213_08200 [Flavobacteriaceae bacterium]|nr:hypothetical protein [Flavobacteriaceae bacterium]